MVLYYKKRHRSCNSCSFLCKQALNNYLGGFLTQGLCGGVALRDHGARQLQPGYALNLTFNPKSYPLWKLRQRVARLYVVICKCKLQAGRKCGAGLDSVLEAFLNLASSFCLFLACQTQTVYLLRI